MLSDWRPAAAPYCAWANVVCDSAGNVVRQARARGRGVDGQGRRQVGDVPLTAARWQAAHRGLTLPPDPPPSNETGSRCPISRSRARRRPRPCWAAFPAWRPSTLVETSSRGSCRRATARPACRSCELARGRGCWLGGGQLPQGPAAAGLQRLPPAGAVSGAGVGERGCEKRAHCHPRAPRCGGLPCTLCAAAHPLTRHARAQVPPRQRAERRAAAGVGQGPAC